jgi:hypothetical protein
VGMHERGGFLYRQGAMRGAAGAQPGCRRSPRPPASRQAWPAATVGLAVGDPGIGARDSGNDKITANISSLAFSGEPDHRP